MQTKEKRIKVHYLWGDQEPCFYYACRLAQEEYSQKGHHVFTTNATRNNIMEDYADEECLLLQGLCADDMKTLDLAALLEGRYCNMADLSNLKTIIITAHCEPIDFVLDIKDEDDLCGYLWIMAAIDHEYKICNTDAEWIASISLVSRDRVTYEEIGITEIQKFNLLEVPPLGDSGYYEKIDFRIFFMKYNDAVELFIKKAEQLSIHDQRKLWAACSISDHWYLSVKEAYRIMDELGLYSFYPDILTYKDLGYFYVYEKHKLNVPTIVRSYFKFD